MFPKQLTTTVRALPTHPKSNLKQEALVDPFFSCLPETTQPQVQDHPPLCLPFACLLNVDPTHNVSFSSSRQIAPGEIYLIGFFREQDRPTHPLNYLLLEERLRKGQA